MNLRHGVRARHLAAVAVVTTLLSALLWEVSRRSGGLVARPSWVAVVLLLVMAGLVLTAAWPVRQHLAGRADKALDPLRAARAGILAQAAALTGAGALGWYLGAVLVALRDLDLAAVRGTVPWLAGTALAAAVVVAAGLLAQSWCRLDDDPSGDTPTPRSDPNPSSNPSSTPTRHHP